MAVGFSIDQFHGRRAVIKHLRSLAPSISLFDWEDRSPGGSSTGTLFERSRAEENAENKQIRWGKTSWFHHELVNESYRVVYIFRDLS